MDFDIAKKYKIKYSDIVVIVNYGDFCFVQDSDARLLFSIANMVVGHNGEHSINAFEVKRLDAIISLLIKLHIDYLVMSKNQPTNFRRFEDNAYSKYSKAKEDAYYIFVHVIRSLLKKYNTHANKKHYFMYLYETLPNHFFENPILLYDGSSIVLVKGYLPITKLMNLTKKGYHLGNKDVRWEFSWSDPSSIKTCHL